MFNLTDPDPADVEEYLKLNPGSFDHIPHYAREGALDAIRHVMELEKNIYSVPVFITFYYLTYLVQQRLRYNLALS